jgi:hypothetical protein
MVVPVFAQGPMTWGLPARGAFVAAVLIAVAGCGETEAPSTINAEVALVLHGGSTLGWVNYTVFSSDDVALLAGGASVTDPNAALSVDLMLPPGEGDVLAMSATTETGALCSGTSAPFDVVAGLAAGVSVTLVCTPESTGADHCPAIVSWNATPLATATPPLTFELSATASDSDPGDVLSFAWTATEGTFSDAAASAAVYTCGAEPAPAVTLTIDDNHTPSSCSTIVLLPVDCARSTMPNNP